LPQLYKNYCSPRCLYKSLPFFTSLNSRQRQRPITIGHGECQKTYSQNSDKDPEKSMSKSLLLKAESAHSAPRHKAWRAARNDTTITVTAVTPRVARYDAANDADALPVATLLGYAQSAIGRDVGVAREYLSRALALLQADPADAAPGHPVPTTRNRGGLTRWQIDRIARHVGSNIGSPIKATDLAALVRLSASHFFHAFKDSFAETPLAYVARRRMALAQQMMLTSDVPLAQIALACGLCDQSHFTRVFRRVIGTSPHAWRRQHALGPRSHDAAGNPDTAVSTMTRH
jgi:AraC-like DNA-binding protein